MTDSMMMDSEGGVSQSTDAPRNRRVSRAHRPESSRSRSSRAVCPPLVNYQHGGEKIAAARWPKLAAYVERVHARPSFKAVIEEERKALAG